MAMLNANFFCKNYIKGIPKREKLPTLLNYYMAGCASSRAMYLDLVTDCSGPACAVCSNTESNFETFMLRH